MISSRSKKIYVRVSEFYKKRYKVFLLLKDKTYVRATNKTGVFKKNIVVQLSRQKSKLFIMN